MRESQADTPNVCQPKFNPLTKIKITLYSYNKPRGDSSGDLEFINLLNSFKILNIVRETVQLLQFIGWIYRAVLTDSEFS